MSFADKIKISPNKIVSEDNPVFIIAEIGVNHEGNYDYCIKMINAAKRAGANAAKIQLANAKENYNKNSKSYKIYMRSRLSEKNILDLFDHAKKKGIILFATCDQYYFPLLKKINQKLYKISSSQAQDLRMIFKINEKNKPMIISTGMNNSNEITQIIKFLKKLKNKKIILLHCVSKYPLNLNETNLSMISFLKKEFKGIVGYSDHTVGIKACVYAVINGAKVIEKHFTFNNKRKGYDHQISSNFNEFKNLVQEIRKVENISGSIEKNNYQKKNTKIKLAKRSFFLDKNLKKGERIKFQDIYTRRIGKNSSLIKLLNILNKRAVKNLKKNTKINYKNFN